MNDTYRIRPAGRHLLTIGRELIQDQYAAVVELVKNAYDADSPDVYITFQGFPEDKSYSITIEDHGHGMDRDTVINKWLVPSTDDKLKRKTSPKGRTMQGRKGIGRYAASILGKDLLLETVTSEGEKTSVLIFWDDFAKAEFLDEVPILVETQPTRQPVGTKLTINGDRETLREWDEDQVKGLKSGLRKLTSPVATSRTKAKIEEEFGVYLAFKNFIIPDEELKVEPFPIFDLFDYKISGRIQSNGEGVLNYTTQKARNILKEKIDFSLESPTECGTIYFDIRVYDREPQAIEALIQRGLKDEDGNYIGKLEARGLLNRSNGIGVYRNGFRIRPLGDPDFDWLRLNEQRVQNPSLRIGSNQVIGYVLIQAEEQSGLIEKSARDGLRDNIAFKRLRLISQKVIAELEARRFAYREKAGLSRPTIRVERELERLFAFDELKQGIRSRLKKGGIDEITANEIIEIIGRTEEEKNRIAEQLRQTVAIYQGQATLGKIVHVILHEGRRPLNYFKNQIPDLSYWINEFYKTDDPEILQRILNIAEGVGENADIFVKLFSRLDPLASGRRGAKRPIPLRKTIENTFTVFQSEIDSSNISIKVSGPQDFNFLCWRQDIYAIFTNLIDNSIYWINETRSKLRNIQVDIVVEHNELQFIDYRDSGPGIDPQFIESEIIFDPEFSTKVMGTGLGLAIAGEAASRNGLQLKAFESEDGAYFRLQISKED